MFKLFILLFCIVLLATAAYLAGPGSGPSKTATGWVEVAPGILRSPSHPAGYALIDGDSALLIDAPQADAGLDAKGVKTIEGVILTHYHRGSCGGAAELLKKGIKVRAAKDAAPWLTVEGVKKYWLDSLPLRSSNTAYLVLPEGLPGVDCSLEDGQTISWRGWTIQAISCPGHAMSHLAFTARKGKAGPLSLFSGGAVALLPADGDNPAGRGKMWAPYTTDWDHWTDKGLAPAAKSLRRLAELKADRLFPAHGAFLADGPPQTIKDTLLKTADAVAEIGFLKSFERFTKQRLGNAPAYGYLAKDQAMSNGTKPWTQVSEHLFLTGNTYVLTSRDNRCLIVDPWEKRSAEQFVKLQGDRKLGPVEVVMFSHAHFDHYDGIYHLADRTSFEIWMLDKAALPVIEPFRLRAPFLDARPVKIDKKPADGDVLTWHEYRFRFHFFPGQSEFTMGVETVIDGKKCFFTADNFFHQDMYSGSGGWMGLNRSWPVPYGESAEKVLKANPDWVLAEHGGPFEFNAEDFRRRMAWAKTSARAADALSLTGDHRLDWNPHRVHIEPLVHKVKPGDTIEATLVVDPQPAGARADDELKVTFEGRGYLPDQNWQIRPTFRAPVRHGWKMTIAESMPLGRNVFPLRTRCRGGLDASDGFLVIDVQK